MISWLSSLALLPVRTLKRGDSCVNGITLQASCGGGLHLPGSLSAAAPPHALAGLPALRVPPPPDASLHWGAFLYPTPAVQSSVKPVSPAALRVDADRSVLRCSLQKPSLDAARPPAVLGPHPGGRCCWREIARSGEFTSLRRVSFSPSGALVTASSSVPATSGPSGPSRRSPCTLVAMTLVSAAP